jgi:hypothetical protein
MSKKKVSTVADKSVPKIETVDLKLFVVSNEPDPDEPKYLHFMIVIEFEQDKRSHTTPQLFIEPTLEAARTEARYLHGQHITIYGVYFDKLKDMSVREIEVVR